MQIISKFLVFAGLFISPWMYSQSITDKAKRYGFISPVDIPIYLSGNYGEIRSTHFHAGIDIKTEQVEGKNVLAAREGHIFRIVVQSSGYGKALYLRHPDGMITVYAHMQQFTPAVEQFVKQQQYLKRSYEVDLAPQTDQFSFQQGDLLGYTGNTGNTAGPHLHFEIRDQSSVPLNVLEFGLNIADKLPPKINWLAVYPLDRRSTVNGRTEKLLVKVTGGKGHFTLPETSIQVSGKIGFGIETYDFLDGVPNACSPASVGLIIDDRPYFVCRIDSIPFSLTSYVNSHIDYEEKMKSERNIQKLFLDPGNKLNLYKPALNRGVINFTDVSVHRVKIIVKDTYGNESVLPFEVQSTGIPVGSVENDTGKPATVLFRYDSLNVMENQDIRIAIPRNALSDNTLFRYSALKNDSIQWSAIHLVHDWYTPLFKSYILSIRPYPLPDELQSKAYIAYRDRKGKWVSQGGEYKNGFVTTRTRSFGNFCIAVDTLKPEISPVAFQSGMQYGDNQVLSFKITDDQSGIRKYNGYIDNMWALFEYDAKNNQLNYTIDSSRLKKDRSHDIRLIVTDHKDNVTIFTGKFFY